MVNARERRLGHGKGRGSEEAIEKRRAARALNALFQRSVGAGPLLDGRAERRRQRLLRELRDGRRGVPLPPIEVLTHAAELLELGESLASIERFGVKPRKALATPELVEAARRVQAAYGMPPEIFSLIGLDLVGGEGGDERAQREKERRR
ncbi:MAG: hypothetical protein OHK0013_03080 [Sandaracinaceae bacterium]